MSVPNKNDPLHLDEIKDEEESNGEDQYDDEGKIFHEIHYDQANKGDRILMASRYQIPGRAPQWYRKGIIGLDPHLIEEDQERLERRRRYEEKLKILDYGIENEPDEDFRDILIRIKSEAVKYINEKLNTPP
jgi:DNA helicase HerA-like ATPase